jgi:hypothetical protein
MIRRPYRHQRARSQFSPNQAPPGPAIAASFSVDAYNCRLQFSAPVVVNALPIGITRQAAGAGPQLLPTSYNQVSATVLDLTYAAHVAVTDVITIPANVPEIRGVAGGNLAAATHTF